MERLNNFVRKYLVFASPFVAVTVIWGMIQSDSEIRKTGGFLLKALWELMSWSLIAWFVCLFIFMLLLVFRKETQDSTIKYLAGLRERDEREEVIMGVAAKRAFTATTSFLIFLLFLSCFTLSIAKLPPEQAVDRKNTTLSIGFHLTGSEPAVSTSPDGTVYYEHRDLPLSKSAIILVVLIWQVATFRCQARREIGPA
jgi:hypothetical protein